MTSTCGLLITSMESTRTAAVDEANRMTTTSPWTRLGGRGVFTSMFAASRGARKVASQSSASTIAKQPVTPKASRKAAFRTPVAAWLGALADGCTGLLDIGHQGGEPHSDVAKGVHDRVLAGIDHDLGLRADTHCYRP